MVNVSDEMHSFLASYLVESENVMKVPHKSCLTPHIRALGLIGLEFSILIIDICQLAVEILIKIILPLPRGIIHLCVTCFPNLKKYGKKLKDINEAANPSQKVFKVGQIVAGLIVTASIGWLLPCIIESWHNTLNLTSPKGVGQATILLTPL